MHTPVCDDSLEWWPEGSPTDVDVSTLPAAGAVTTPLRIPGFGPWLGFWGPSFSGLRIGISPTGKTYPVVSGLAVPYPIAPFDAVGIDVYLSRDTGGAGTATIARFRTREAAQAWGGAPTPSTSSGGGTASLPNRSTTVRTTIGGGGSTAHVWTQAGFLFATVKALPGNVANVGIGPTIANALFDLPPGAAENNFVGSATGCGLTGTASDDIEIIEYGRV